jgi:UDP-N-acetyl-D-galactosamine dehydrogenase
VAEAAKVVENIQRDVNIALVNELALVFDRLGIDTGDVLEAAGTKWNFLPFRPGLVGGHCIGVDPYYLLHKSESLGYHPELIRTARQVNERVGAHVAGRVRAMLAERGVGAQGARVLVLGVTFKENCPDLRNSRALDLALQLAAGGARVDACDPWADPEESARLGVPLRRVPEAGAYDAVVLAVAHDEYRGYDAARVRALGRPGAAVYDVKSVWPRSAVDDRL